MSDILFFFFIGLLTALVWKEQRRIREWRHQEIQKRIHEYMIEIEKTPTGDGGPEALVGENTAGPESEERTTGPAASTKGA
jgi:hypothetical protein